MNIQNFVVEEGPKGAECKFGKRAYCFMNEQGVAFTPENKTHGLVRADDEEWKKQYRTYTLPLGTIVACNFVNRGTEIWIARGEYERAVVESRQDFPDEVWNAIVKSCQAVLQIDLDDWQGN